MQSLDYGIAIRVSGFSDKVPVSLYAANLPLCNSDPVDAGVGRVAEAKVVQIACGAALSSTTDETVGSQSE